jgi:hypothetical protein
MVARVLVIVARVLICLMLFCLPFVLYIAASGQPDAGMILVFPVFGAIPAILGALLIFVPVETYLDRRGLGHLKNKAIPLAGALLIAVFMIVMWGIKGRLLELVARVSTGDIGIVGPILLWSVLGAIWGALWRVTAWIAATAASVWRRITLATFRSPG